MSSPPDQTTTAADLGAVVEAIRGRDRFLVTTHENPDGDALGSLLASNVALLSAPSYDGDLTDIVLRVEKGELIVTIASVTLGAGAPLLPRAITTPPLRLVSVSRWSDGFAQLRYQLPKD